MKGDSERARNQQFCCDKCSKIFDSKGEYERHVDRHAGGGESCPIDSAISKLLGALRLR